MTKLSRDEQQRRWEAFRARPGNSTCAECAASDTTWAVLDYGILICIHCAGAHRALGSHISKVRSTELDDFDESLFLWFESLGNAKHNQRWEAELPATIRRPPDNPQDCPECVRRWWLREKYDEMRFLAGSEHAAMCGAGHANPSPSPSHRSSPNPNPRSEQVRRGPRTHEHARLAGQAGLGAPQLQATLLRARGGRPPLLP